MSEEWPGHNTKPKEIFVIIDFCYESMETLRGDRTIKLNTLYIIKDRLLLKVTYFTMICK